MPPLALDLPRKEPNLFATLTPPPHDDETDEEIDMDVERNQDREEDGDPHRSQPESDLLFKLMAYLNHLHHSDPSPAIATLDTHCLFLNSHPPDRPSLPLSTSRSTRRRRPRNLRQNA